MNSQECRIAVLEMRLSEETARSVGLAVDFNMQKGRADALQKELEALKKELETLKAPKKKHAKPNPPNLAAVG